MTFADKCLERANKATPQGPACNEKVFIFAPESKYIVANLRFTGMPIDQANANYDFYYHARREMVELAERLNATTLRLRSTLDMLDSLGDVDAEELKEELDFVDAMERAYG